MTESLQRSPGAPAARSLAALLLVCTALSCASRANTGQDPAGAIDGLMKALYGRGQFNGSVAIAVGGRVLYRNAFGQADLESHRPLTLFTPSCLASVSKQFTAMAVMILADQGRVRYDDPVSRYLPELSRYAAGVTVRHLLNHTSGIPDVGDLGIDHPRLTNDEVLRTLVQQDRPLFRPGQRYRYSNTGYVLLSLIVERITGEHYGLFLADHILGPLGMTRTFLDDGSPANRKSAAVGYNQFGKRDDSDSLTTGDGGIYSTVDDLLKWDAALSSQELVRPSTLAEAFTPGAVKEGTSSYGFGWNVSETGGQKVVWHTGSTHGFRAFVGRRLGEQITVILLTNRGNSRRVEINDAIVSIIEGKPYSLPKRSIAEKMYDTEQTQGIEAAIRMYEALETTGTAEYDFEESELNSLGYQLLYGDGKTSEAVRIFELNARRFPASSNAFDSVGEAYAKEGNRPLAIQNYRKAVELDPTNLQSLRMLRELER